MKYVTKSQSPPRGSGREDPDEVYRREIAKGSDTLVSGGVALAGLREKRQHVTRLRQRHNHREQQQHNNNITTTVLPYNKRESNGYCFSVLRKPPRAWANIYVCVTRICVWMPRARVFSLYAHKRIHVDERSYAFVPSFSFCTPP